MERPEREGEARDSGVGEESGEARLTRTAVRGAFWTIVTSNGSRVIGLTGTVLITRFLAPEEYGVVTLAALVMMLANVASNCGLSQYIVSKPNEGRAAVFHATFYFTLIGIAALGLTVLAGAWIGPLVNAPELGKYLPGLAVAALLERVGMIQDRILVRDMRFFSVGVQRSIGEIAYAVVSVALAALCPRSSMFGGPHALVWASIARAALRLVTFSFTTPRAEWLTPCRITWQRTRDLFQFGLPMSVATLFGFGSRKIDNFVFAHHFGAGAQGIYNYAYNLADIPATQIGENIGDVLVPSFAKMTSEEQRRRALLLSMRMLVLIVAPLAVGLAVVATPLVEAFFTPEWYPIAAMLPVLSALSVVRPIGWVGGSYLQVKNRPRVIMVLEIAKTVVLIGLMQAIAVLTRGSPTSQQWVCVAVGLAFTLNSFTYLWVIRRIDGIPLREQIVPLLPPLVACAPMALAVLAFRGAMSSVVRMPMGLELALEVLVGVLAFVPSALLLAPSASRDLIRLARSAIEKRRRRSTAPSQAVQAACP